MATEIVKSTAITNLDATPPVRSSGGQGAGEFLIVNDGSCATTSGVLVDPNTYYRLVRIPSDAIVKKVEAWLDAAGTTITGDIGLYYSDDAPRDGSPAAHNGAIINADHFGSAVALASVVTPTDYTFEAGTYTGADTRKEVWNTTASGLSSNPRGFFDVVFTPTSTVGSSSTINLRVHYTRPGA